MHQPQALLNRDRWWNPEREALLLQLLKKGLTVEKIAKRLPFLRHCKDGGKNAVCGKLKRLRDAK
jgi:hypothetical protein